MTIDLTRTPVTVIAAALHCSLTTAGKLRREACIAAGLPTPAEQREERRRAKAKRPGTTRGYRQVRGPQ